MSVPVRDSAARLVRELPSSSNWTLVFKNHDVTIYGFNGHTSPVVGKGRGSRP
jgi:hypothetical protein